MFWQQGKTHYLQLANPKKKVLENWGNLWIFSKSSFGFFIGNVCFFWQTGEFFKMKKKKTSDDLYKSLIIFLYSWLHTRKKKRFWQIFTILFSLVAIENLWKHFNLEFLTFNFIFWWNFASKNKGHAHYTLTKGLMPTNLFMSSNHVQHRPSFFSCSLISLGYLDLHFPSDLVSWDYCYKKFPRQTQN